MHLLNLVRSHMISSRALRLWRKGVPLLATFLFMECLLIETLYKVHIFCIFKSKKKYATF